MPRCWFSCGSRKDKPEEDATKKEKPGASSNGSAERPRQPATNGLESPGTNQPEAAVQRAPELTTSQILWNAAYDSLKAEDAALVKSYMKVMTKNLQSEGSGAADGVLAEADDPVKRQLVMEMLVREGLQKIEKTSEIAKGVGVVANGFLKAKGLIDTAIGNIPQAALPWAGVCVILQVLTNPMQASQANKEGMEHVVTNMDWYCSLSEHILSKEYIKVGEENYEAVHDQLKSALVKLYKALLLYQMKSVCSYYRDQVEEILRQMLNSENWGALLKDVENAKTVVENYMKQFTTLQMRDMTGKLVKNGEESNELLSGVRQDIQQQNADQKKMHLDDETAKCLRDLNAVNAQSEMEDMEARKGTLIKEAYEWVLRTEHYAAWTGWDVQDPCRLLWINGPAGTGKTMLLMGIIRELEQSGASLTYFFCQSAKLNLKDATSALRSLILLLVQRQPQLASHLLTKYRSGSRFDDGQAFWTLKKVFLAMLADQSLSPVYLIVDALDECDVETPGREQLIDLMSESLSATDKIRWLVSSRPEVLVYEKLKERATPGTIRDLDVRSKEAVNAYIEHHLHELAKRPDYTPKIRDKIAGEVRQRAMNTFLWVALVFKELHDTPGMYAMDKIKKCPDDLVTLYDHLMEQIERGQAEDPMYCKSVLADVCLAYRPLSIDELHVIAGLHPDDIPGRIVKECGSFLTVQEKTVSLVHLSAREWLMSNFESRLQKGGVAQVHADIWRRSIAAMAAEESGLKRNICGIEEGTQSEDIVIPSSDPLAALRYSCEFWIDHLLEDGQVSDENCPLFADDGQIFSFFKVHFLHWLESLSILQKLSSGQLSIIALNDHLKSTMSKGPKFVSFLKDAEIFVRRHRMVIEQTPLQIYGTALALSPTRSDVRNMFWKERLSFIESVQGVGDAWDACLQTLKFPDSYPQVAFSPDGRVLVSAASRRLHLWDLATGGCKGVLEEGDETHKIYAVAFSPDGNTLTTVAKSAVRFWDVTTEACKKTLDFPDGSISASAFSLDGACLAVASGRTICLWDTAGMVCKKTIKDVPDKLEVIALSPDGKLLFAYTYTTLQVWDIAAERVKQTIPDRLDYLSSAAFSPDSKTLALAENRKLMLWDVESATFTSNPDKDGSNCGVNQGYLETRTFYDFAFTADRRFVALTLDGEVQFWDAADPIKQIRQDRYNGRWIGIRSISRSPDGNYIASVEHDGSIKVWDGSIFEAETGLGAPIEMVHSSPDNTVLLWVSGGNRGKMQLWTADGVCTHTLTHPSGVCTRTFSGFSSVAFSPDGKIFASGGLFDTVRVWDVETGRLLHTLKHYGERITRVVFSSDGTTLAAQSSDAALQLWDPATGSLKHSFEDSPVGRVLWEDFSPDGKLLVARSSSEPLFLLSIATGVQQTPDNPDWDEYTRAAFSPDCKTVAAASAHGTLFLWDTATGTRSHTFKLEGEKIDKLSFSDDGKFLLTNLGRLRLDDGSVSPLPPASEDGLEIDGLEIDGLRYDNGEWVSRQGKNLLYIPAGQRPTNRFSRKMFKNILFIGDASGQITCYKFKFPSS